MDNKKIISRIANFFNENAMTMNTEQLTSILNWNELKTTYDTEYEGKRGIYRLIHVTYDWLVEQGLDDQADNIATVFRKPDGKYAYEKE